MILKTPQSFLKIIKLRAWQRNKENKQYVKCQIKRKNFQNRNIVFALKCVMQLKLPINHNTSEKFLSLSQSDFLLFPNPFEKKSEKLTLRNTFLEFSLNSLTLYSFHLSTLATLPSLLTSTIDVFSYRVGLTLLYYYRVWFVWCKKML